MSDGSADRGASSDTEELHRKARKGIRVLQARQILLQGLQLVTGVALARLLEPADFGLYAISTFVVSQISSFSNFGLSAALIQQKDRVTDRQLRVGFTAQLALLGTLAFLGLCLTPFLGHVYPKVSAELPWLVRALILLLLVSPFHTIPIILLERELDYSNAARIDIAETVTFQVSCLVCAFSGMGVWSFVVAALARGTVGLFVAYRLSPWRPGLAWDGAVVKKMVRFGLGFQAQSLVNDAAGWAIPLVAGGMLGPVAVGFLTWASSNGKRPLILVESTMQVAFSHFSRIQDRKEEVRKTMAGYLRWMLPATGLWLVLALAFGAVMTQLVYGRKWLPGVPYLQLFAAGLLFDVQNWAVGVCGNALGLTRKVAVWVAVKSVLSLALTIALIPLLGKMAVPFAWIAASAVSGTGILLLVRRSIGSLTRDVALGALPGLLSSGGLFLLQRWRGFEWTTSFAALAVFAGLTAATLPLDSVAPLLPWRKNAPKS